MMNSAKRKSLIMAAVIAAVAVLFAVLSNVAAAAPDTADSEEHSGYIPVEKDVYQVPSSKILRKKSSGTDLPSYYRSDEQPWAERIKVKDQDWTSLCWAFSTITAAEYSYAKEMNKGKSAGEITPVKEMSPSHLGYFFYNRVNDPRGNTVNDINKIITNDSWADIGGNELFAMQHLAAWSGAGAEEDTPFEFVKNGKRSIRAGSFDKYKDDQAYKNYVTQEESIYFDSPGIDKIKQLIKKYGAVSGSLYYNSRYISDDEHSFFNKYKKEWNHAVTVVGWNDNYPKSAFKTKPDNDGAWIVQNSWGTGSNENGYFYVSYESIDMKNGDIFAFDMQPADTYQHNFLYDGTADCGDSTDSGNERFRTVQGTKAANVYTNNTGEAIMLEAVGFTTFNNGDSDYQIDVYTGVDKTSDPTSGIHAGTTNISTTTPGCKTAVLKEPVLLGSGERYSIVFSFAGKNAFGVEKTRSYESLDCTYKAGIDPGQSFIKAVGSDTWKDMNDYNACFRIKGFANDVPASDIADKQFTVQFEDGFGNIISTQKVKIGQPAGAPEDPQMEGRVFAGWDRDFSCIYKNTVVNAKWKKNGGTDERSEVPSISSKKVNTLTLKGKTVKVRYKKLRKRAQKIKRSKIFTVKKAKGKLTYKIAGVKKAKYKKYFKINKVTGKLKIKKRLRKGKYKIKVKVTAAGNKYYKPAAKMVTFKVRVK